jgi:YD repeat-containing protein
MKIGYKASYNGVCKGWKFEVGKTYETSDISICDYGFHYCKKIDALLNYYGYNKDIVIFKIEDMGNKLEEAVDKNVTNRIKIVSIVDKKDYNKLFKNYKFDKNNNMIEYIGDSGRKETWKYDKNNNKIEHIDFYGDKETWKYDKNNNMIEHIFSDGRKESWKYDKNNNKIEHISYSGIITREVLE